MRWKHLDLTGLTKSDLRRRLTTLRSNYRKLRREWKPLADRADRLGHRMADLQGHIDDIKQELALREVERFDG